ncbi:MAG: hypothetical protein ABSB09_15820 [Acidimicrobiales bacterium]|jgi:hypothetical protein
MASNSTGKWVQRAATTGGGRTYRGQMPVNWYATLALIIVVGLALVGLSRYQLSHRTSSSAGPPTTSQTWYAALGTDICGTVEPDLPANTDKSATSNATPKQTGLHSNGNGVVTISPLTSSEAGSNATLGTFVSHYKGLELSDTTLQYPGKPAYTNGDVCPKGTPDSGKPGVVIVYSWPNFTAKQGSETPGNPQSLLFQNGQLITMAFVPATTSIPKPPASAITNLIDAAEAGPSTPTSTTAPSSVATTTPTTAPTSTTATTAATSSTATTKPGGSKG